MSQAKMGEALASVMDRMEKYEIRGDLAGYELREVIVVAAYTKPRDDADELEPDAMESFVFVDGTTQVPYIQTGILRLAIETAINPD